MHLQGAAEALVSQGFDRAQWVEGDLTAGQRLSLSLPAPDDRRIAAVAIGSPEELFLDLRIRESGSGDEVASDLSKGRRAAASFPARRGRSYEVIAAAVTGAGRATLALFEAPAATPPPRLAGIFDGGAGAGPGWRAVEDALRRDGFAPVGRPLDFDAPEGARLTSSYSLEAGRCYALVALGSPGIDSLELRLSAGPELLSADLAGREEAWTAACPGTDLLARASVNAAAGTGTVRLGLFSAAYASVADRFGPPLGAEVRDRSAEALLRQEGADLSRRGYGAGEILSRFRDLGAGDRRAVPLPAGLEGCYAVAAAAGEGAEIDLRLVLEPEGGAGAEAMDDASEGATARLSACHGAGVSPEATLLSMGEAAEAIVALYRLPGAALPEGGGSDPALAEAAARFAREGLGVLVAQAGFSPCARGLCASLRLEGGRCYGAVALPGGGRVLRLEAAARGAGSPGAATLGGKVSEFAWCPNSADDFDFTLTVAGAAIRTPSLAVFGESGGSP